MIQFSHSLVQRDIRNVLHPYTNVVSHDKMESLFTTKGERFYVLDDVANKQLAGLSGLWCTSLGFNNEHLIEVTNEAMLQLPFYHTFGSKSHPAKITLSEELMEMTPVQMSKVFLKI